MMAKIHGPNDKILTVDNFDPTLLLTKCKIQFDGQIVEVDGWTIVVDSSLYPKHEQRAECYVDIWTYRIPPFAS